MKKVAIVGVEGSGKTVLLVCLADLYTQADRQGYFLHPADFDTIKYVNNSIKVMRRGSWPAATVTDFMQGLNWQLRRKVVGAKPEEICDISCLDFAGEVYRAAYGISKHEEASVAEQVTRLKQYVSEADEVVCLINLNDVIDRDRQDPRVLESTWITNEILTSVLWNCPKDKKPPRAAIVLTQSDAYRNILEREGGAAKALETYLPHIANNFSGQADVFSVCAVDKTCYNDDDEKVPDGSFTSKGLQPLMDWVLEGKSEKTVEPPKTQPAKTASKPKKQPTAVSQTEFNEQDDPRNPAEWRWLKTARMGNSEAQYNLGLAYQSGEGAPRDDGIAARWFLKAAESGHTASQKIMAYMYEHGVGVSRDLAAAELWGAKAAIVEPPKKRPAKTASRRKYKNEAEREWLDDALAGDSNAQYYLGLAYALGDHAPKDCQEALKWYKLAAANGSSEALTELGCLCFSEECHELPISAAMQYFDEAARRGDGKAKFNIGLMYEIGCEVARDERAAINWYRAAANSDDEGTAKAAKEALKRLGA